MVKKYIPIPPWKKDSYVPPVYRSETKDNSESIPIVGESPSSLDDGLKIYAEKIYGIEGYERSKLIKAVRNDLGIVDKSRLITKDDRVKNFEVFKDLHFLDPFHEAGGYPPTKGTKAYTEIQKYCQSSYGSLMIKRILIEKIKPKFSIGVSDSYNVRAHGKYERNYIILPVNFPSMSRFPIGGQVISGSAIIHHEFEHTRYGHYKADKRSIKEEWYAVRYNENPVRILLGLEPRYVYYSYEFDSTVPIFDQDGALPGKWTFNKRDPSSPMVKVK